MPTPLISVDLYTHTATPRVAVRGELEIGTAEFLTTRLAEVLRICPRVVLDLREIRFLDSAGLRVLFGHREQIQAVLVDESSAPARALMLSGFGMVIPLATEA